MDSSRDNNCMGVQGWIGQTGGVDKRDTVRYIQSQRPGGARGLALGAVPVICGTHATEQC